MKNTVIFLLFNILLFSAPALQAMGMLHTIGKFRPGKHVVFHSKKKDIVWYAEKNTRRLDIAQDCIATKRTFEHLEIKRPSRTMSKQLLPLFEAIKMKLDHVDNVALVAGPFPEAIGLLYHCKYCDHKVVVVDHHFCHNLSIAAQKFVLAHELAHASKDHIKEFRAFQDSTFEEKKKINHAQEHEADEEAVRALGTIEGALEFFSSTVERNENSPTHPSHKNRIEKLQAQAQAWGIYK